MCIRDRRSPLAELEIARCGSFQIGEPGSVRAEDPQKSGYPLCCATSSPLNWQETHLAPTRQRLQSPYHFVASYTLCTLTSQSFCLACNVALSTTWCVFSMPRLFPTPC